MSNVYQGTIGLIGNTPLVEFANIEKELGLEARVLAKLEYFNPAGSVKDRIAKEMVETAEDIRQHRHRPCFHRGSQGLQDHPDNAGDDVRREKKHSSRIRR